MEDDHNDFRGETKDDTEFTVDDDFNQNRN